MAVVRAGAVAVAFVVVTGCGHLTGPARTTRQPVSVPTTVAVVAGGSLTTVRAASATVAGPPRAVQAAGSVRDVPTGWPHTGDGARAAAVGYVGSLGRLFQLGIITQHDTIVAISSRSFGESLASSTVSQLDKILAISGREGRGRDGVVVVDSAVTASIAEIDIAGGRALVKVWAVLVVAALSDAPAYEWWHTTTVSLVWERDDWRIDGWDVTAGPAPAPNPKAVPASFDQIVTVGRWPTAMPLVAS